MQYKTFPWNQWIDLLLKGDAAPFFEGLRKAVYMSGHFKGKKDFELRKEYGDEAKNEIVQVIALNLLRGNVIKMFRARAFDDGHIAAYLMKVIRHTITDLYDKKDRENATFVSLFETAISENDREDAAGAAWRLVDCGPTPEAELENKEVSNLLLKITAQLTQRQIFILREYKPFGGAMSGRELAVALTVSIQTINKEVSRIRTVIRTAALNFGYSPIQESLARAEGSSARHMFLRR